MLSSADNDTLTRVGPGTPMGALMRQYWIPALRSDELPGVACAPVRVLLLGERLIAFRDSTGAVGLLREACPHRGASLFFGRTEPDGLRCAYHGWKFNARGECLERPCEPHNGASAHRLRTTAYPCVERGGVVWAYLGPREVPPPLPDFPMNQSSPDEGRVDVSLMECNWLQNLEGDIDVDHVAVLHGANLEAFRQTVSNGKRADIGSVRLRERAAPVSVRRLPLEIADSAVGCTFASHLTEGTQERYAAQGIEPPQVWAIGQFMFPFYAMLPYGSLGAHWVVARVPMDDHHTMTFGLYSARSPRPSHELMFGPEPRALPNSADVLGRFRLARNPTNDFGLQRQHGAGTRGELGLGGTIQGQAIQDAAITHSMGPIADRTREHLGPGDAVIVRVRKQLLSAARALSESGAMPPGVDQPEGYRVRQGMVKVRPGRTWHEELTGISVATELTPV